MGFMNWIAGYIGWTVCILAGVVATAYLVGIVTEYAWFKFKEAHAMVEIQSAVKAYKKQRADSVTEEK